MHIKILTFKGEYTGFININPENETLTLDREIGVESDLGTENNPQSVKIISIGDNALFCLTTGYKLTISEYSCPMAITLADNSTLSLNKLNNHLNVSVFFFPNTTAYITCDNVNYQFHVTEPNLGKDGFVRINNINEFLSYCTTINNTFKIKYEERSNADTLINEMRSLKIDKHDQEFQAIANSFMQQNEMICTSSSTLPFLAFFEQQHLAFFATIAKRPLDSLKEVYLSNDIITEIFSHLNLNDINWQYSQPDASLIGCDENPLPQSEI